MTELPIGLRGWLIGFAIAAPVGPIGVLCIRRTLAEGRWIGFLTGLGAATADMLYGAVAAFGLTAIQELLLRLQLWLRIIGGLFLLYLGIRTFILPPATRSGAQTAPPRSAWRAYGSTVGLTLTNPATILSFTLVFAGLRLGDVGTSYGSAALLVAGVFLGSASWWLLLSAGVGLFRDRVDGVWLRWINRLAGMIICAFGVAALAVK
jgi:threonine/homoserine/homoserine lactone efflux protein